jgi:mRNA interferase MazF
MSAFSRYIGIDYSGAETPEASLKGLRVYCADLGEPGGSAPGYRRPVVVVQCDALNTSRIGTVVCVPLTSNLKWERAPGNVLFSAAATSLPKDSVANVSLIVALDKRQLVERVGKIPRRQLELVLSGIDVIVGR